LGIFLPLLCDRYRNWKNVLLFGFLVSLSIELMQMYTLRTTDINDLLTNCLGACLGYFAVDALLRRKPGFAFHGSLWDVLISLAAGFDVMFFVQPFLI
ncbi:VanZ family protein, partial [Xanthomonas citri pv. citri]|nr:VanZ family protein [Xanthomonas citri pv. citri]